MGQVQLPQAQPSLILSAVDRLIAANADGGIGPGVSHIILLGEAAGQNDAASNVIGLGFDSLGALGTGLGDVRLDGSIAIGQAAASFIETAGNGAQLSNGNIAIGRNAMGLAEFASANVVIGDNALGTAVPTGALTVRRVVVIGANAALDADSLGGIFAAQFERDVIVGFGAARPDPNSAFGPRSGITDCVIIGDFAANNFSTIGAGDLRNCVVIGAGAGLNLDANGNSTLNCVIVGDNAGTSVRSAGCTMVGSGANCGGNQFPNQIAIGINAQTTSERATAIGASATVPVNAIQAIAIGESAIAAGPGTIAIGAAAPALTGERNIQLGIGAGTTEPAANANRLIIETMLGGVRRGVLYGEMIAGNLIVGKSTPGVDRDLAGTNTLKILDGTSGILTPPVGGGRFYVTGGELSWLSSAGVGYDLTPSASRGVFAVAALPAALLIAGQRAYVNDALAPAFGAAPVGGGAVFVPVFYDGAAWIVG
jgi:hypothetical protein